MVISRVRDDFNASELSEQVAELVPRQLFVVDDDRPQIHLTL